MVDHCEHCGASLIQRWDRITAGEIEFLIRFRDYVIDKGENLVNVPQEMNLSNVEYSDFQKLRFHALIAKHKEDGRHKKGHWVLTRRGNLFIKGEIKIPERVRVFRNKITGYSENEVSVQEVLKTEPYWDSQDTIEFEPASMEVIESSKAEIIKQKRKKRGVKTCPQCKDILRTELVTEDSPSANTVIVKKFYVCENKVGCGFRQEATL